MWNSRFDDVPGGGGGPDLEYEHHKPNLAPPNYYLRSNLGASADVSEGRNVIL